LASAVRPHLVKEAEGLVQVLLRWPLGHLVEDDVEVAIEVELAGVIAL
jgi:hypothetical protein